MDRKKAIALTLTFITNSALISSASATGQIHPILVTGMHVPDQPEGVLIDWLSPPVMNRSDDFVAYCRFEGPGVTASNDAALLFVTRDGEIETVVRAGQLAPGIPGDVRFVTLTDDQGDQPPDYQDVALNDLGHVFFRSELTGPGIDALNNIGLFFYDGAGNTSLLARKGSQVPGMEAGVLFGGFSELRVNNRGDVVFNADLVGNGITDTNDFGLFKKFDGLPIETVFAEGDFLGLITPQIVYGGFPNFPLNPVLTDQGDIWYATSIDGVNPDGTEIDWMTRGVLLRREVLGDLRLIARSGEFVAGSSSGLRDFTRFFLRGPNEAYFGSSMSIVGSFTGLFLANGVNPLNVFALDYEETQYSGIFYSYMYVWEGNPSNFDFNSINDLGDLGFVASIFDTSLGAYEDAIFLRAADGVTRFLARKGGRSADFGDSLSFFSFQWPLLDNTGRVVFHSTLTDDTQGLFVNSAHDLTRTLVRAGDELEIDIDGSGLVSVEIESFSHPNEFNDTGALAIRVGFGRNEFAIVRILVPHFGTCPCPGDMNEDGRVAGDDLQDFVACLVDAVGECDCANVNGFDGVTPTDIADLIEVLFASDSTCP